MNGIWGTLAVGLFATDTAPGYSIANASGETLTGLFYGGGFDLCKLRSSFFKCRYFLNRDCFRNRSITGYHHRIISWTAVTITITFLVIRAIAGLRVDREEEMAGLDAAEHGLPWNGADYDIHLYFWKQIRFNLYTTVIFRFAFLNPAS